MGVRGSPQFLTPKFRIRKPASCPPVARQLPASEIFFCGLGTVENVYRLRFGTTMFILMTFDIIMKFGATNPLLGVNDSRCQLAGNWPGTGRVLAGYWPGTGRVSDAKFRSKKWGWLPHPHLNFFLHRNTLKVYLGINFFIQLFLSSDKSAGTKKFFFVPKVSDVRATALRSWISANNHSIAFGPKNL